MFKNGTLVRKSPLTLDDPIVTAFVEQKESDTVTQISPDLNLNSLLVKHQIDNPSQGAMTGGKISP